jgi:hypothetical protein
MREPVQRVTWALQGVGCGNSIRAPVETLGWPGFGGRTEFVHPTPEEQADELEKLRDLRDKGVLSDEEYDTARKRLRRY